MLIDCGRDYEVATLVTPFLRSRGVDRLNALVLTHGDVAHVEGYARVARDFDPAVTYTSPARSRSPKYRDILRRLETTPRNWQVVAAADYLCGWRVLHPQRGQDFSRGDDEAIVLSRDIHGRRVTLLSELGGIGQRSLLARGIELKSSVVIGGPPTGGDMIRPDLMLALQPNVIVVAGNDAKAQRAWRDLQRRSTNVLSTIEERAITVTGERGKVFVESISGTRADLP